MPLKQAFHLIGLGNVATHKLIGRIPRHLFKVAEVSRVGEQVVIHDLDSRVIFNDVTYKAGANKTRTTGHKYLHCRLRMDAEFWMAACEISSGSPSNWLATSMFVRNKESNVPASDHQPSTME